MLGTPSESHDNGKGPTRDEVLKRLYQTPPKPHKPKKAKDSKKQSMRSKLPK